MSARRTIRARFAALTAAVLASVGGGAVTGCAGQPRLAVADVTALETRVATLRAAHPDVRVGYWIGDPAGAPAAAAHEHEALATASAIKVAYLVELYAEHAGRLDEPLKGTGPFLDPDHPAVAHFDAATRTEIAEQLGGATCRELGWAMIRSRLGPDGPRVSNAVYNAAANLSTALCGGPRGLTERIHARFPAARDLQVRRYMLAARDVTGDNTATPAGLATVFAAVARAQVSNVDRATVEAIRETLHVGRDERWGEHFYKGGSLDSDPQCRILAGSYEPGGGAVARVYAVMVEAPADPVAPSRSGERLARLAADLRQALLTAVEGTLP